ncbi:hypothetical protein [Micavibrio aeruginosavorus]|uniref:hypothetical protein n=1 Tax=Micavibrio aeruginosavorus TaxID=349221 RepID=UPI003F4AF490
MMPIKGTAARWGKAIVLSFALVAGCQTSSTMPDNDNHPPYPSSIDTSTELTHLFTRHSATPVIVLNSVAIENAMDNAPHGAVGVTAETVLPSLIKTLSGVAPSPDTVAMLGSAYYNRAPVAIPNHENIGNNGSGPRNDLWVVFGDLPGIPEHGTLFMFSKIHPDNFKKIAPDIDVDALHIPPPLAERFIKLHEGFHAIDTRYTVAMHNLPPLHESSFADYARHNDARMQIEVLHQKAETFADVASALKMAQEGHAKYLTPYAASRGMAQYFRHLHSLQQGDTYADMIMTDETGMIADKVSGWPDNLTFVPQPFTSHNTVKGLLMVNDFVARTPVHTIRTMTMDDILAKAYAITEAATPSPDTLRAQAFYMWRDIRKTLGETTDPLMAQDFCPPPCASAITPAQRAGAKDAYDDYINTLNRAVAPYRKPSPAPTPQS